MYRKLAISQFIKASVESNTIDDIQVYTIGIRKFYIRVLGNSDKSHFFWTLINELKKETQFKMEFIDGQRRSCNLS